MSVTGVNDQGALSVQELMDLMGGGSAGSSSGVEFSSEMTDKLMTEFDANEDGFLNEFEFNALTEKMQGMQDMMVSLQQTMQNQGGQGGQGGSGAESSEEDEGTDIVGAFMDSVFGSEDSLDEADTNGDGVISEQEMSGYLGAQYESMQAQKKPGDGDPLKQQLMDRAMSAYQVASDSSLSDSVMSMGASTVIGALDAVA